jgi:hypothetical protein
VFASVAVVLVVLVGVTARQRHVIIDRQVRPVVSPPVIPRLALRHVLKAPGGAGLFLRLRVPFL